MKFAALGLTTRVGVSARHMGIYSFFCRLSLKLLLEDYAPYRHGSGVTIILPGLICHSVNIVQRMAILAAQL